jgi:hypothetical protein
MRTRVLLATALLVVFLTPAARAEDDTATALLKSAGSKGGEIAAKALAGLLYDTSCPKRNNDAFTGYVCVVLGSVSGRTEDKWKEDVTNQLKEINSKVDTLTVGQAQIQKSLAEMKSDLNDKFNAVAQNVVAVQHLVRIEGLWEKYEAQFDKVDDDVTRDSMVNFAKEIIAEKPHTMLADLNAVLTKGITATGGQPLVRYPLSQWRIAHSSGMTHEPNMMEAYDYAEKRFVDFRMREEKAYAMYLWAANVLETQCNLQPAQCTQPPRSTKDFKDDWNRYTQQQAAAFNSAVDWLLLSYSTYRVTAAGTFLPINKATDVILRANYVTSTMLGNGEGLWGRVISMGNAWDGSLQVTCGGSAQTLKPVLKYAVPAGGGGSFAIGPDSGDIDWWVSTQGNSVYDEVHFSPDWQNYIYNLPSAKAGPCSVSANLPKGGVMPWVQPARNVTDVHVGEKTFPFGSFIAIQRAGGTQALVSGKWVGSSQPQTEETGKGSRKKVTTEWIAELDHNTGPYLGFYTKGRAEYTFLEGGRIRNKNRLYATLQKDIRFPDDRRLKLTFTPGGTCRGELCSPSTSTMFNYDIENNKGKLDANVSVMFRNDSRGSGIFINGSYGETSDKKSAKFEGTQTAVVETDADKTYRLQYEINFDLETEGFGSNAADYMYRGWVAAAAMYLTK